MAKHEYASLLMREHEVSLQQCEKIAMFDKLVGKGFVQLSGGAVLVCVDPTSSGLQTGAGGSFHVPSPDIKGKQAVK